MFQIIDLEYLLIGCLFSKDSSDEFLIETFKSAFKLLDVKQDSFEKVPYIIYASKEYFEHNSKQKINKRDNHSQSEISFYEDEGIMIYDGIYASASGEMKYVYRSKGMRIYYCKDGELKILTSHSTIDNEGFQLCQELVNSFMVKDINSIDQIIEILHVYIDANKEFNIQLALQKFLKSLTHIVKPFKKAYFIEYLLFPPDVHYPSDFSLKLKDELWTLALSSKFKEHWNINIQNEVISLLSHLGINPNYNVIINFLKNTATSNTEILEKIEQLENNLVNIIEKENIIEFKPNIGGLGFNGNEAFRRLQNFYKKYFL